MPHYKGIICSIGLRTSGRSTEDSQICQISIVPLDIDFKPRKDIKHFNCYIKVEKSRWTPAGRRANAPILDFCDSGMSGEQAIEALWQWWTQAINRSQIHPLGHRWAEQREWLAAEMGSTMISDMFSKFARDTHVLSQFVNDRHDTHAHGAYPFNRVSLWALANELSLDLRHHVKGEGLNDALLVARVFRAMVNQMHIPSLRLPGQKT